MSAPSESNYPPIITEEEAQRFLEQWREYAASDEFWNTTNVNKALRSLEDYPHLDALPFYLACLGHPDRFVRSDAIHALGSQIEHSPDAGNAGPLFRVLENDPHPHVRGAAAYTLGWLARIRGLPEVPSRLLSVVNDPQEDNFVRLDAYKGIIYLFDKEGDHRYHPFKIDYHQSAESQIDWEWIRELEQRYRGPHKEDS